MLINHSDPYPEEANLVPHHFDDGEKADKMYGERNFCWKRQNALPARVPTQVDMSNLEEVSVGLRN